MKLDELVQSVSDDQRLILDEIWNHYVSNGSWIPAIALYQKFKREQVLTTINGLGGSIVYVSSDAGERARFIITFLGSLLTKKGGTIALMFLQYLKYIKERLETDYELKEIDGARVRERLQMDAAESRVFVAALQLSPFSYGGSFGEHTWTAGIPPDVDDLFSGISVQQYFETKSLQNYDPSTPTDGTQRMQYLNSRSLSVFPDSDSYRLLSEDTSENPPADSYDVFLSYASQDSEQARVILNSILAAGGTAFMSDIHLKAGDNFADSIRRALTGSTELWLLLTPNSLKSEWVTRECGAAWALDKRIIPILLGCEASEAPDSLRNVQCIVFQCYEKLVEERFSKT